MYSDCIIISSCHELWMEIWDMGQQDRLALMASSCGAKTVSSQLLCRVPPLWTYTYLGLKTKSRVRCLMCHPHLQFFSASCGFQPLSVSPWKTTMVWRQRFIQLNSMLMWRLFLMGFAGCQSSPVYCSRALMLEVYTFGKAIYQGMACRLWLCHKT